MQLVYLIYPILLTYNNKLVHSPTGLTPIEARDPSNELEANVNMQLKAQRNIKYSEILYIYLKRTKLQSPTSHSGLVLHKRFKTSPTRTE